MGQKNYQEKQKRKQRSQNEKFEVIILFYFFFILMKFNLKLKVLFSFNNLHLLVLKVKGRTKICRPSPFSYGRNNIKRKRNILNAIQIIFLIKQNVNIRIIGRFVF